MKDNKKDKEVQTIDENDAGIEVEKVAIADTGRKSPREMNWEIVKSPAPTSPEILLAGQRKSGKTPTKPSSLSPRDSVKVQEIQERCRQLCLPLFYQEQVQVHSLGFTSAVAGEGKTFLSIITAEVLASDLGCPVTLVECNWEHPSLSLQFGLPATPGLAEWLREECSEEAIRHKVGQNLAVISAGDSRHGAVKLLHQMLRKSLRSLRLHPDELFVVDLPPIANTACGSLAANMVESLVMVVHAQVTPDAVVAKTCEQLKDLPLHGIVLNQTKSRIPRWLRQIL